MAIEWAEFKFPPLNLLNMCPHYSRWWDFTGVVMEEKQVRKEYTRKTDNLYPPISNPKPRIDIIGSNGNDGLHYEELEKEKEYAFLEKLVEDHWDYIKGVLEQTKSKTDYEIYEIGFHYKTAMRHGWKHAMEYLEEWKP